MQKGRFLDTESVSDVPELLHDPTLDVVIVRAHDQPPKLTLDATPGVELYDYDPKMTEVDGVFSDHIEANFPGLAMAAAGLLYDRSVTDKSINHYDEGSEDWRYTGPLACSWAISGQAVFGAERDPETLLRPNKSGEYRIQALPIMTRRAVKTLRAGNGDLRTTVHQREGDRVFFLNLPWATNHSVDLLTEKRLAHLFDHVLYDTGNKRRTTRAQEIGSTKKFKITAGL